MSIIFFEAVDGKFYPMSRVRSAKDKRNGSFLVEIEIGSSSSYIKVGASEFEIAMRRASGERINFSRAARD